jgi:5'-3' exoribonuclease 2
VNVDSYEIKFELSEPFKPIEQLLAVLPVDSVIALPECCQWLMTDSSRSPIIDIYDNNIKIDPNGKALAWLWVVLLPFIDERRILKAMEECQAYLSQEEACRNSFGTTLLFVDRQHNIAKSIPEQFLHASKQIETDSSDSVVQLASRNASLQWEYDTVIGQGTAGFISLAEHVGASIGELYAAPDRPVGVFEDIVYNTAYVFTYELPVEGTHQSSLLPGLKYPEPTLSGFDLEPRRAVRLNRLFNITDISQSTRKNNTVGFTSSQQQPFQRMIERNISGYNQNNYSQQNENYSSYHQQPRYNNYNNNSYPRESGNYDRQNYRSNNNSHYNQSSSAPPTYKSNYPREAPSGREMTSSYTNNFSSQHYSQHISNNNFNTNYHQHYQQQHSAPVSQHLVAQNKSFSFRGTVSNTPSTGPSDYPTTSVPPTALNSMRSQLFQTLQQQKKMPPTNNNNYQQKPRDPRNR